MNKVWNSRWTAAAAGAAAMAMAIAVAMTGVQLWAAEKPAVETVFSEALPTVPGKKLTIVRVSYGPGGKSASHAHAGSVFAYVLSGEIRSENSVTGPVRVYKAGEGFFEPPGSVHRVSENASATEPASLLAIFVADEGATLTAPSK